MRSHLTRRGLAAIVLAAAVLTSTSRAQTPSPDANSRIDALVAAMTLDEKISMLHGGTDPEAYGQAGYLPGVPRLGIPPLRLTDGPAGPFAPPALIRSAYLQRNIHRARRYKMWGYIRPYRTRGARLSFQGLSKD